MTSRPTERHRLVGGPMAGARGATPAEQTGCEQIHAEMEDGTIAVYERGSLVITDPTDRVYNFAGWLDTETMQVVRERPKPPPPRLHVSTAIKRGTINGEERFAYQVTITTPGQPAWVSEWLPLQSRERAAAVVEARRLVALSLAVHGGAQVEVLPGEEMREPHAESTDTPGSTHDG